MPIRAQSVQFDSDFSYKQSQVAGLDTHQHDKEGEATLENEENLLARHERGLTTVGLARPNSK
jgi:hypothetical protein